MDILHLSKEDAKTFMVNYHFLNQEEPLKGYDSIQVVFDRIKSIQYDPLNVVGNNSELVMQSRIEDYKIGDIQKALYEDRTLVDGWDKQMGIYQTKYFSHFNKVREHRAEGAINTLRYRLQLDALDYVDEVKEIIKENPKFSSEIKIGESKKHRWGHTKPSSATLDYLFHKGELGIRKRRNTQKQFDLIENLIDPGYFEFENDNEFIKWYLYRRIKTMGLVWNKSSVAWSGLFIQDKKTRKTYLEKLIHDGLVQKVKIEGIKEMFYAPYDALTIPLKVANKASIIAPLDNFIWDRELILKLFNFDYKWEVYTPVRKRRWGYYVLPILYRNNLVARIEFDKQRKKEPLIIKKVWFEEDVVKTDEMIVVIKDTIKRFKKYLGSTKIENMRKVK